MRYGVGRRRGWICRGRAAQSRDREAAKGESLIGVLGATETEPYASASQHLGMSALNQTTKIHKGMKGKERAAAAKARAIKQIRLNRREINTENTLKLGGGTYEEREGAGAEVTNGRLRATCPDPAKLGSISRMHGKKAHMKGMDSTSVDGGRANTHLGPTGAHDGRG